MLQAAPMHTPLQQQLQLQLLRVGWGLQQLATQSLGIDIFKPPTELAAERMEQFLTAAGIDMTKAPTEFAPVQPATAPPPQQTPFGSCVSAVYTGVASGAGDAQGAAQGNHGEDDHDEEADSSGVEGVGPGADANDDDDSAGGGHGSDADNAPPSSGAVRASTRRASTRARKAPRRYS